MTSTSFATSVASIKGVYNFQLAGFTNQTGYYSGSTWVKITTTCPTNQHCFTQAFPKLNYGTISFDGLGHATFTSITSVNNGSGGPVKGTVLAYFVSGFNGRPGSAANSAHV